ncbi:MAG: Hpt domain-containing response regulator [Janthinobacterium lividum]
MPPFCLTGHRVLVAEDNPTNSLVMKTILEQAGCHCTLVRNGEQAFDMLVHYAFDAALLDLHMPLMNGLEVTKAFRFMRPGRPRLPLILFSADSDQALCTACRHAGADEFLPKPIQAASLLETLARLLAAFQCSWQALPACSANRTVINDTAEETVLDAGTLAELEKISPDPAFLDALLGEFMLDNGRLLERLERSLAARRREETLELLHALKGSAVSIGAVALKTSCQRFERNIGASGLAGGAMQAQGVRLDFARLCDAIESYRRKRLATPLPRLAIG